ncbi:MAG: hypothetical protein JJE37_10710 [Methyloceanibacter sp.]|nr:hypothetical protein [Methyloceanibacter sp.]
MAAIPGVGVGCDLTGCTTGHLLARVRRANNKARPNVNYVGIDIEPNFISAWDQHRRLNLGFERYDARASLTGSN